MSTIDKTELVKKLYAQDASMYQELPLGVAFPRSATDIKRLVKQAKQKKFSITARSAGTSLAGQATGAGVIMDVSRFMTELIEINVDEKWALVEPGVIRDSLNRKTEEDGLLFGPDTATTNRCMIGGMIGNNSAGLYSIKYQTTREHILEIHTVLSDGSEAIFKPLSDEELVQKQSQKNLEGYIYRSMLELLHEYKDLIINSYPHKEIIRRNTGFALDKLCEMSPITSEGRPFNLAELLCGSEGTLALTTKAKLNLEKKPKFKKLVIPQFNRLNEAMEATVEAVRFNPSAVELVDDVILKATEGNAEQRKNRFFLSGNPRCILIIQFEGDNEDKLNQDIKDLTARLKQKNLGYTFPKIDDPKMMTRVWDLRKAGLGLLMGLGKESRTPAFCEDTAVRVRDLPRYVRDFQEILDKHDTQCVFYAHASVGELHLRPMIDTTTLEGITKMKKIAEEVADLVRYYQGSLSGEHGDGRARSPYIEQVLGKEMMPILKKVKEIWDADYIFNPGKIVNSKPIEKNLRYHPAYEPAMVETMFKWRNEDGFNNAIELCNGAGVCRKLSDSGGTMCPSYMATEHEKDSTRGRANIFRQVFSGDNPETFESKDLKEALKLCLSCKACKTECPANVDMAKMKAEFLHGWHKKYGVSKKESFFANAENYYALASQFPSLANMLLRSFPGKMILKSVYGISTLRDLPKIAPQTFMGWFARRPKKSRQNRVLLVIDLFTNYHEPEVGKSAVEVIEKMGYEVIVPSINQLGRVQLSKGMLDEFKEIADSIIEGFYPFITRNIPIVGLEPSEILTLRDEFLDIVDEDQLSKAKVISSRAFTFEEFVILHQDSLPESKAPQKVVLSGHCHTKAITSNNSTILALEAAGFEVEELDTGCCGMAGSFGYESDNYEVSMEIGWQRLFPQLGNLEEGSNICAPGFSCRHQILDGTGMSAQHPAVLIANNLI